MYQKALIYSLLSLCLIGLAPSCSASDIKVSADALERTLKTQLFSGEMGRYYFRGDPRSDCSAYAEAPHVSYSADRVVVHMHTAGKLGKEVAGRCWGIPLNFNVDVSFAPQAEGEVIGFKDAKLEKISDSAELNFFLQPFLSRKVPANMKINAAEVLRKMLFNSRQNTGYAMSLDHLLIQSMQVRSNSLVVTFDGDLSIN